MASIRPDNQGRRGALWPRVRGNRGRRWALWLRFTTEAKGYPPLASPQYASVREPVQNMKITAAKRPSYTGVTFVV